MGSNQQMTHAPDIRVERIESIGVADLNDLCDAAEAAIRDGGGFGWVKPPAPDVLEAYWRGVILIPERDLFVVRLDGVIAGSCQLLLPTRNNEAQCFACNLTTLFVAPWARGHSLASRLLAQAEQHAVNQGFQIINLDVRATQTAAIQLYRGAGYTRFGVHPRYARVDGKDVTGEFYFKRLSPGDGPAP